VDSTASANNYTVQNNVITNPLRACIALFGAQNATVRWNECTNPIQAGISITFGWTRPNTPNTNFSSNGFSVQGNTIISGQNNSSIQDCVYLSGDGTSNGNANSPSGDISNNVCSGNTGAPLGADRGVNTSNVSSQYWRN
jgi:hypothetical protein